MFQKIKKGFSIFLIIVLLPYIVTIFVNGKELRTEQLSLLDEYCIGVLAKEVSSDYEDEMLKAQAVIVRTTIYSKVEELKGTGLEKPELDVAWYQKLKGIWKETEGQVAMYNGQLALLPFHQISNGKTRSGQEVLGEDDYPYLQIKECPKDIGADEQMQTMVIPISNVEILSLDSAGYVTEMKVGEETCSGDGFRNTYELASSCFEVQGFEDKTRITTRGVGHGLGLSQFTANEMAKEGKTYKEILQFFFSGIEIKEVAEILWQTE